MTGGRSRSDGLDDAGDVLAQDGGELDEEEGGRLERAIAWVDGPGLDLDYDFSVA